MKTINKTNSYGDIQTFEILTSRKELANFFKNELWEYIYSEHADEWNPDKIYNNDDTSISYYDKYGKYTGIFVGDKIKRPNISNITKMMSMNACTVVLYGDIEIVYNEHYGDWEAKFD